jgi:hypothetical protein
MKSSKGMLVCGAAVAHEVYSRTRDKSAAFEAASKKLQDGRIRWLEDLARQREEEARRLEETGA